MLCVNTNNTISCGDVCSRPFCPIFNKTFSRTSSEASENVDCLNFLPMRLPSVVKKKRAVDNSAYFLYIIFNFQTNQQNNAMKTRPPEGERIGNNSDQHNLFLRLPIFRIFNYRQSGDSLLSLSGALAALAPAPTLLAGWRARVGVRSSFMVV